MQDHRRAMILLSNAVQFIIGYLFHNIVAPSAESAVLFLMPYIAFRFTQLEGGGIWKVFNIISQYYKLSIDGLIVCNRRYESF